MKKLLKPALLAIATTLLVCLPTRTQAQPGPGGGGNFDPAEMRQRMMDRYKEMLDIKSDDEWNVIQPRIQKVQDARRDVGFGGGMRGMFGGAGGRRGGDNPAGGDQAQRGGGRGFGGQPSATAQALQSALEAKAPTEQIKTKLDAYREERKQKQAALAKAQEDLKKVLNVRQEAAAVLAGLLE
jgi:hypothetical protein